MSSYLRDTTLAVEGVEEAVVEVAVVEQQLPPQAQLLRVQLLPVLPQRLYRGRFLRQHLYRQLR